MFLHPWAIVIGVLAAGLPVAVHWLTRPRPVRLPVSTLRFIREAVQQKRARHRLRDLLILALRTLAVLLLAMAVARPLTGEREPAAVEEDVDVARIVVLDVSQSMAARRRGIQAFERARPVAARHLQYESGLKANLVLAGARPSAVFGLPSTNFAALRDALADASPRAEALNVEAALNAAAEMLAGTGDVRRELIVVSDFQRTNWATADFSPLPADTVIQLESVAPDQGTALSNLALLKVAFQGRAQAGRELQLEVEVGNYASAPRQVRAEVALGSHTYQLDGNCPPNSRATLTRDIVPDEEGWQVGEARLVDPGGGGSVQDALPEDNRRPGVLEVRPPPTYAILTRQPAEKRPSSSYYLQRALAPYEKGAGRETARVVRLDPLDLDREILGRAELIVIDHPGRIPSETVNHLASLLRRGRGLLYVAAEPADATNLKLLTDAAGSGLQMPVSFAPPTGGRRRRDLFLTQVQSNQPPFAVFGDNLAGAVEPLRFSGGLASRKTKGGLVDDIVATFSDGSAFLVVTASEAGSLAVINADLERSNLSRSGVFVPLLTELVQRLLGQRDAAEEFATGRPIDVYLPEGAGTPEGLKLLGPDGLKAEAGFFRREPAGLLWHADSAPPPGVYRTVRGDETVYALATTLPAEEADLRWLSAEVFRQRLAGGRSISFRSAAAVAGDREDTLWTWLAVACIGCLLGEVLLLRMFKT